MRKSIKIGTDNRSFTSRLDTMNLEVRTYAVCTLESFLTKFRDFVHQRIEDKQELQKIVSFYDAHFVHDRMFFFKDMTIQVAPTKWAIDRIKDFPLPTGNTQFGLYLSYISLRFLLQTWAHAATKKVPFHTLIPEYLFEGSDLALSDVPISFLQDEIDGELKDVVHIRIGSWGNPRGKKTLDLDFHDISGTLKEWETLLGSLDVITKFERY